MDEAIGVRSEAWVVRELGRSDPLAEEAEQAVVRRRNHQLAVGRLEYLVWSNQRKGCSVTARRLAGRSAAVSW